MSPGLPQSPWHALVGGAIGGYFVWGNYSSVNYQIVLYLTSRVLVGLWKRVIRLDIASERLKAAMTPDRNNRFYAMAAATVWGIVMLLFEECGDVLHPSLKQSMDEIYRFSI